MYIHELKMVWHSYRSEIEGTFIFEVDPQGTCDCFKKRLERCLFYDMPYCKRRKCDKKEYDDNCMEIDEC